MIDLGHLCQIIGTLAALYALVLGTSGAVRQRDRESRSAARAVYLSAWGLSAALVFLAEAFISHRYKYVYVWRHSSNEMEWYYLISGVWGGMEGSLLLWGGLSALFCALLLRRVMSDYRKSTAGALPWRTIQCLIPVLAVSILFFAGTVCLLANPFVIHSGSPVDGNGLNPLLQNPSMMWHPPSLYMGLTGLVVPASLAFAVLLSGAGGSEWLRAGRRSSLVAWAFLTAGIVLGGNWAYLELGWGGFWAWDPVENASFMPWLSATAFVHTAMVEERRGLLRRWNVFLALVSYWLSIFGTFLTRSGVVQSVHAFAQSEVGEVFLVYLIIGLVVGTGLLLYRWKSFGKGSEGALSFGSREGVILLNNLVLLGISFGTLWGVMYPVWSEALYGTKQVVGPPFFNAVNGPLFVSLLALMAVGPMLAWRSTSWTQARRALTIPAIVAAAVALLSLIFTSGNFSSALAFGFAAAIIVGSLREIRSTLPERPAVPAAGRRWPQLRRFSGHVVHLGFGIMAVGITAAIIFQQERDFLLKEGESATVGPYQLTLSKLSNAQEKGYEALIATMVAAKVGEQDPRAAVTLQPERRFYMRNQEFTSEVSIQKTPLYDLYVAFAGVDVEKGPGGAETPRAVLKVYLNPLQVWVWIGALVMLGGMASLLASERAEGRERRKTVSRVLEPVRPLAEAI